MSEKSVDSFESVVLDAVEAILWFFLLPAQSPAPKRDEPVETVGQNQILSVD